MKDAGSLCKVVADIYREATDAALREVNTRVLAAVEGCSREIAQEHPGPERLTRFTRCLALRTRR